VSGLECDECFLCIPLIFSWNLKQAHLGPQTPVYSSASQPVTVSLELLHSNPGNVAAIQPFSVKTIGMASSQQLGAFTVG
jgi:hypothetical protein